MELASTDDFLPQLADCREKSLLVERFPRVSGRELQRRQAEVCAPAEPPR